MCEVLAFRPRDFFIFAQSVYQRPSASTAFPHRLSFAYHPAFSASLSSFGFACFPCRYSLARKGTHSTRRMRKFADEQSLCNSKNNQDAKKVRWEGVLRLCLHAWGINSLVYLYHCSMEWWCDTNDVIFALSLFHISSAFWLLSWFQVRLKISISSRVLYKEKLVPTDRSWNKFEMALKIMTSKVNANRGIMTETKWVSGFPSERQNGCLTSGWSVTERAGKFFSGRHVQNRNDITGWINVKLIEIYCWWHGPTWTLLQQRYAHYQFNNLLFSLETNACEISSRAFSFIKQWLLVNDTEQFRMVC